MFAVVVLTLVGAMLVVGTTLALMFLTVAFERPSPAAATNGAGAWDLPLLKGEDLRKWAARQTQDIVNRYASARRGPETGVALAEEIGRAATTVVDRVTPAAAPRQVSLCPSDLAPPIGVTPPEALAIAAQLKRDMPKAIVNRVRDQARFNLAQLANPSAAIGTNGSLTCPLLDAEGLCATWEARPIHCRSHCQECVALGKPCATDVGTDGAFALNVGKGVTQGLNAGLAAAGLDGHAYEFNGALVAALETPDAAARWAKGEPVFSACQACKE